MTSASRSEISAFGLHDRGNIPGPDQDYVLWGEVSHLRATPLAVDENLDGHYGSPLLSPTRLFIVADGMGGKERGEEAARDVAHVAFDAFRSLALDFNRRYGHRIAAPATGPRRPESLNQSGAHLLSDLMVLDIQRLLLECVQKANEHLWTNHAGRRGSTLVLATLCDRRLFVAHVGDSRAYLIRPRGTVELLTEDHNAAWDRIARGEMSRTEARRQGLTSMLTRYAGAGSRLDPAGKWIEVAAGDRVLLCTDGLYDAFDRDEVLQRLVHKGTPEQAAQNLIETARARGGDDNISALVVDVDGSSQAPAESAGRSSPQRVQSLLRGPVSRFTSALPELHGGMLRRKGLIRRVGIGLMASAGALSLAATASLFPGAPREPEAETSVTTPRGNVASSQPATPTPEALVVIGGTVRSESLKEDCALDPLTRRYKTRGGETVDQIARWCEADAAELMAANRNIPASDALPQDLVLNVPAKDVRPPTVPTRSAVAERAPRVDPSPVPLLSDPLPEEIAGPAPIVPTPPATAAVLTSTPTIAPVRTVTPGSTPAPPVITPAPQNPLAVGPVSLGASVVDQAGCRLAGFGEQLDVPPVTVSARFDYTGSGSVVVRWYQDGVPMTEWRSLALPGPKGCRLLWFGYTDAPLPAARYTLEVALPGGGPDGSCCPSSQRALQWAWVVVGTS